MAIADDQALVVARTVANVHTGNADTTSRRVNPQVTSLKGMAVDAVRLLRLSPASNVLGKRHSLKVIGPYAAPVKAQMVDGEPNRDGAVDGFVGNAVSKPSFVTGEREGAVLIAEGRTRPIPAPISNINLRPEALTNRRHQSHFTRIGAHGAS